MIPLISIIIPVYNVEAYLKQCLDSIINQTLKNIEIICVDDGSTDNSLNILKEYQEKDNRIIILQQQNQYAGIARNNGLKVAKGKYLSFLDSDDFFELDMLEKMYKQAIKDRADIVICGWKGYDNLLKRDVSIHNIDQKYVKASPFSPVQFSKELFDICKPNPWTKLFDRQFFIQNSLKFEDCICCNDLTCICTAMVIAKKITILDETPIHYRFGHNTSITSHRNENFRSVLYAIKKLEKNLNDLNVYDTFKQTFIKKAAVSYNFGGNNSEKAKAAIEILSPELYSYVINYKPKKQLKRKYF